MYYKTILAVTDLSVTGNEAVQRATLLATNCGAELQLMYVPVPGNPPCRNHDARLQDLARSVSKSTGLSVKTIACSGASVEDVAAQANCADLLVARYRRNHDVATFFRGAWHQRVMRLTRSPVLLTRTHGRQPYAMIVVAVTFTEAARQLARLACHLDERAEVELFHAIGRADEAKLRSADVSWDVITAFREQQDQHTQNRMLNLIQSINMRGRSLGSSIARGEAGLQTSMHQQIKGAALVVVGKKRRSALLEFLSGGVSNRILARSSADVLIVPHDHQSSSRAATKQRIAAEQEDGGGDFLASREGVHRARSGTPAASRALEY